MSILRSVLRSRGGALPQVTPSGGNLYVTISGASTAVLSYKIGDDSWTGVGEVSLPWQIPGVTDEDEVQVAGSSIVSYAPTVDPTFSPVDLFASGEKGAIYDFSDLTSTFQDVAMTTAAEVGDTVGAVLDLSGNGNTLVQSSAGDRPTLAETAEGEVGIAMSDHYLQTASALPLGSSSGFTIVVGFHKESDAGVLGHVLETSGNAGSNNGAFVLHAPTGTTSNRFSHRLNSLNYNLAFSGYEAPTSLLVTVERDGAAETLSLRVNGIAGEVDTDLPVDQVLQDHILYVGKRSGSFFPFNGTIYSMVIINRELTATERNALEAWTLERMPAPELPDDTDMDVFLLIGQSNMVGVAFNPNADRYPAGAYQFNQANELVPATIQLDHHDANGSFIGLGLQFTIDYMAANPGRYPVLIPRAKGGSSLSGSWVSGGFYREDAIDDTNAFLAAHPGATFKGILWHQGESDSGTESASTAYATNLDALVTELRADITGASSTTPFVCGGFVPDFDGPYRSTVEAALAGVNGRVGNAAYVTTTDLDDKGDDLHFSGASLRTLGSRYYTAFAGI